MEDYDYKERKAYIQQIRESFDSYPSRTRISDYATDIESEYDALPRSHFKWRFVLAVCLFLAFLAIRQTDFSCHKINADVLTTEIQKDSKFSGQVKQELKTMLFDKD